MTVTKANQVVAFDIDDTLIYWNKSFDESRPSILISTPWISEHFEFNLQMVENIRQHHLRGHYIILWSQSGYEWCETVAKALGLQDMVSQCMTKPFVAYDDIPLEAWCKRIAP